MATLAFDISLRSTAAVIKRNGVYHLACFAQKKVHQTATLDTAKHKLTVFPPLPSNTAATTVYRYAVIERCLMDWVESTVPALERADARVLIEGYAFNAQSAHSAKLHELGGIMKLALHKAGFEQIATVPPSSWKKQALGNGFATKFQVYQWVLDTHGLDLNQVFGAKPIIPVMVTKRKREVLDAPVPAPIQDLADALAICEATPQAVKKRKK